MLPGTKLGFTTHVWDKEKEKWVYSGTSESKKGHPTRLDEVSEEYIAGTKVLMWHEVSDGNYCIFRIPHKHKKFGPMWTVWTKELFEAVKAKQLSKLQLNRV
jgi:hypothetical protein